MAGTTHTVKYAYHGTLDGTDVDTITLTQSSAQFTIVNRSGTHEIYFTVDGTTPTAAADNTYVIPAAIMAMSVPVFQPAPGLGNQPPGVVVKLICGSSQTYSIEAV